jgi:hypothetical protein
LTNELQSKLHLSSARFALLLDAPEGYLSMLGLLPVGLNLETTAHGEYDFVQTFVTKRSDLERELPIILAAATTSALVWLCYPKAGHGITTDLNRDIVREAVEGHTDWRCVTQIALDATWSALRLRPLELVGH